MYEFILKNFAMHINLDEAERELIKAKLQQTTIKKNGALLRTGDVCRNIYFVNSGCLRVFNRNQQGEEHNILFCPENWWAGDMASFTTQTPAFYSVSALEETQVFYFSYAILEALFIEIPKLERFFRILSQNGFSFYQRRINANLSKTAEERYAQFQRQFPKLEQRIAQKHIASYLGITPVFLSMIRKRSVKRT